MKKLAMVAILLSGCAGTISPTQITGPNGNTAYTMRCNGLGKTLEGCYQKAGELCPLGYNVVSQDSSMIAVPVQGGMMAAPRQVLTIECK